MYLFVLQNEVRNVGYEWLEQKVTYAGIKQRWLIVESAERKQSDIQTLNSKIEQEKKPALKQKRNQKLLDLIQLLKLKIT